MNRTFVPPRLRAVVRVFPLVAAGVALVAAIRSSRATDQVGLAFRADDPRRIDIRAIAGATPTPLPCPLCWQPITNHQDFDAVTPPALPSGWLATNAQGPPPFWATSDSGVPMPPADTPPNAMFVDDPAVVSDKRIDGWFVNFFEDCCVRLTFRHNFNLEASESNPDIGYDGAVLELSTDGGNTFQDIRAVGGSFLVGGYNRTIASDRGSRFGATPKPTRETRALPWKGATLQMRWCHWIGAVGPIAHVIG